MIAMHGISRDGGGVEGPNGVVVVLGHVAVMLFNRLPVFEPKAPLIIWGNLPLD
jgi:hypothetical protein